MRGCLSPTRCYVQGIEENTSIISQVRTLPVRTCVLIACSGLERANSVCIQAHANFGQANRDEQVGKGTKDGVGDVRARD